MDHPGLRLPLVEISFRMSTHFSEAGSRSVQRYNRQGLGRNKGPCSDPTHLLPHALPLEDKPTKCVLTKV